jgi:hypothetical protein
MTPEPLNVRRPTSESELLAGSGIVFTPASEYIAALDALALEVATIRELCELLVDWAGARDRVPADDVLLESNL